MRGSGFRIAGRYNLKMTCAGVSVGVQDAVEVEVGLRVASGVAVVAGVVLRVPVGVGLGMAVPVLLWVGVTVTLGVGVAVGEAAWWDVLP